MKKFMGRHLIVDAYEVEENTLQNKKLMKRMLEDLPAKLKMRMLRKPIVSEIKSDMYPTIGLSGFVILYESHVSFHTWPEENYVAIDVYSCKDFSEEIAKDYIRKSLKAGKLKVKFIVRG